MGAVNSAEMVGEGTIGAIARATAVCVCRREVSGWCWRILSPEQGCIFIVIFLLFHCCLACAIFFQQVAESPSSVVEALAQEDEIGKGVVDG